MNVLRAELSDEAPDPLGQPFAALGRSAELEYDLDRRNN